MGLEKVQGKDPVSCRVVVRTMYRGLHGGPSLWTSATVLLFPRFPAAYWGGGRGSSIAVSWMGYTFPNTVGVAIKTLPPLATLYSLQPRALTLNIKKKKREINSQSKDLSLQAISPGHANVPTLCTHVSEHLQELLAWSASSNQPVHPRFPPEMVCVLDRKSI